MITGFPDFCVCFLFPGQPLGASITCSVHSGDDQCRSLHDHCEWKGIDYLMYSCTANLLSSFEHTLHLMHHLGHHDTHMLTQSFPCEKCEK